MKRDNVLKILAASRSRLREYHVKSLSLFGSMARDEATEASDVDILVEYEEGRPKGLFEFISLMNYLEDILGCKVDLVMREALRSELRDQVLRESIRAA
jgi:hypothetical protein